MTPAVGICLATAAALVVAPVTDVAAAVGAAEPGAVRASLEVDTSEIGEPGPVVRQRILERGGMVFREENVLPADSDDDPRVVVHVHERQGEDPGFAFEIEIERAGRSSSPSTWAVECALCTETELVDRVAAELVKVAATLATLADRAPEPERPAVEDPAEPPGPSSREARGDRRRHPFVPAGIGALAGGLAAVATGVGFVLTPPRVVPDDPTTQREFDVPGYVLLAVGGAAVIAGAALLGVGVKRSRARRIQASSGGFSLRF
jgi:hypothetical protein